MTNSSPLAYFDTNILLLATGYEQMDYDMTRTMNKILYDYKIKIPQIVLGEAVAIIMKKTRNDRQTCLADLESKLDEIESISENLPPPTNNVIKIARELCEISDIINDTDSLVLAHAIADNDATRFFTKDRAMKNDKVVACIKKLQNDGIRDKSLNLPSVFTED